MSTVVNDPRTATEMYLQAFETRDLVRCMEFYADDATLVFHTATYQGRQAIEGWHKERFAADLRLSKLESLDVQGDQVVVDATATSNRLRAWKISSISGRVTLGFHEGKIRNARFAARMGPLELLG